MSNSAQSARVILECLLGRSRGLHMAKYLLRDRKSDKLIVFCLVICHWRQEKHQHSSMVWYVM